MLCGEGWAMAENEFLRKTPGGGGLGDVHTKEVVLVEPRILEQPAVRGIVYLLQVFDF